MSERKPPKLAPNVQWDNGAYYFVKRQPGAKHATWTRLGATPHEAYAKLREIHAPTIGMATVFRRYREEILPKKAPETQKAQDRQLTNLELTFGQMEPLTIRPMHIAQFHDELGRASPVSANRHLALLSSVCKFAMRIGALDLNPCTGISRHPEHPRTRYVTDEEYAVLYPFAGTALQIMMDLARLTGQREGNLMRMLVPAANRPIRFPAQKRGKPIDMEWSEELAAVVARAEAERQRLQKANVVVCLNLVVNEDGQPVTRWGLQSAVRRMWRRYAEHVAKTKPGTVVAHFTFHDLRAKAGSDSGNEKMLGHKSPAVFRKVYDRKPSIVKPVK